MNKFIYFYCIVVFIFCSCGNNLGEITYDITIPDIENGEKIVKYKDIALLEYWDNVLWHIEFKNIEQIKLDDGQIFFTNEIWYSKGGGKLLKLVSKNGSPYLLPGETYPKLVKDIFFNEDRTIHYAYYIPENYYKIYLDNNKIIRAKKVTTHDTEDPKLRNEYKISEIKNVISGETFHIPYPLPNGLDIEVSEINFYYGVLEYIRNSNGVIITLPDNNNATVDFISFYPSGNLKRVNLTQIPSQSIPIIVEGIPKNATTYIEYKENGDAKGGN